MALSTKQLNLLSESHDLYARYVSSRNAVMRMETSAMRGNRIAASALNREHQLCEELRCKAKEAKQALLDSFEPVCPERKPNDFDRL